MSRLYVIMAFVVILVAAVGGSYAVGYRHADAAVRAEYADSDAEKEREMAKERKASRERILAIEAEFKNRLEAQGRQIRELLRTNDDFKAWYESTPPDPDAAIDLIYGMPDNTGEDMQR